MNPVEPWSATVLLLTLALLLLFPIRFSFPRRSVWRAVVLALAILACVMQLRLGFHWQMTPLYLVLALCLLGAVFHYVPSIRERIRRRRWIRWMSLCLGISLVALSGVAHWAFPIFRLPEPTGPNAVGTSTLYFVDSARAEVHTANPLDHRRLVVQAWYPAPVGAGPVSVYWPEAGVAGDALNRGSWPLGGLIGHLATIPTHSVRDAAVAPAGAPLPVVIFSHGLGGFGRQNTALMEDLASNGYVVLSIEHAFDGLSSVFSDGTAARFMPEAYEAGEGEPDSRTIAEFKRLQQSRDPQLMERFARGMIAKGAKEAELSRFWLGYWSADQRFVMDQLAQLNGGRGSRLFAGRLDLNRIAVIGMSFGGSAAVITCAADSRCKVLVDLDGFRPTLVETPVTGKPFLFLANSENLLGLSLTYRNPAARLEQMPQFQHYDFTDAPALSPLFGIIGATGSPASRRPISLVNREVLKFLNSKLK